MYYRLLMMKSQWPAVRWLQEWSRLTKRRRDRWDWLFRTIGTRLLKQKLKRARSESEWNPLVPKDPAVTLKAIFAVLEADVEEFVISLKKKDEYV